MRKKIYIYNLIYINIINCVKSINRRNYLSFFFTFKNQKRKVMAIIVTRVVKKQFTIRFSFKLPCKCEARTHVVLEQGELFQFQCWCSVTQANLPVESTSKSTCAEVRVASPVHSSFPPVRRLTLLLMFHTLQIIFSRLTLQ